MSEDRCWRIGPGDESGLAMVRGDVVALMRSTDLALASELWQVAAGGVDAVLDRLVEKGLKGLPSFAVVEIESSGWRLILRGDVTAAVGIGDSWSRFDGTDTRTWSEQSIEGPRVATLSLMPDIEPLDGIEWQRSFVIASGFGPAASMRMFATHEVHAAMGSPEPGAAADLGTSKAVASVQPRTLGAGLTSTLSELVEPELQGRSVAEPESISASTDFVPDAAGAGGVDKGAYAEMFGETVHRSVIDAAVHTTADSDIPDVSPCGAAADTENGQSVKPNDRLGDHDGRTMSLAELKRLRAKPDQDSEATTSVTEAQSGPTLGPTVQSARCHQGHDNPPQLVKCRTCGAPLDPTTVTVVRPILGVLRFSTGAEVELDRPILVGRKPDVTGRRYHEIPREVQLDVGDGLSRSHAVFLLEGWQVLVEDLGSTNHTTVTLPGREPQRVRSGEPSLITDGAVIDLGGEVTCRYDAVASHAT